MTRERDSESIGRNLKGQAQRYAGNQLIVKLRKEFALSPAARQEVIESLPSESTVDRDFDKLGFAVINLPRGTDPSAIAQEIEDNKAIEYAEPNFIDSGTTSKQESNP